jgi:acyl-CoA dehydrogenase
LAVDRWRVAVAKTIANEAAGIGCAIAHAVHGAIGISEEHDLQLYTRRLKRWQLSFGSDAYWARHAGQARLETDEGNSVDFVRARLAG